jgi:hypothetical protein
MTLDGFLVPLGMLVVASGGFVLFLKYLEEIDAHAERVAVRILRLEAAARAWWQRPRT